MKQSVYIKLSLLTFLFHLKSNDSKCQSIQPYIDSIKHYQLFVDSLVNSYYSNAATTLLHGIVHYTCLTGDGGYGSGGCADIYQYPKKKAVYKLSYIKGCDTVTEERTLYFF